MLSFPFYADKTPIQMNIFMDIRRLLYLKIDIHEQKKLSINSAKCW